jgi:hypothetical protein
MQMQACRRQRVGFIHEYSYAMQVQGSKGVKELKIHAQILIVISRGIYLGKKKR